MRNRCLLLVALSTPLVLSGCFASLSTVSDNESLAPAINEPEAYIERYQGQLSATQCHQSLLVHQAEVIAHKKAFVVLGYQLGQGLDIAPPGIDQAQMTRLVLHNSRFTTETTHDRLSPVPRVCAHVSWSLTDNAGVFDRISEALVRPLPGHWIQVMTDRLEYYIQTHHERNQVDQFKALSL